MSGRAEITINKPPSRRSRGKRRARVKSQPIKHTFDPKGLAEPVAEALLAEMEAILRRGRKKIAPATREYRARAEKAYADGKSWARKRYDSPPNRSDRIGLDSGRLIEGLGLERIGTGFALVSPEGRNVSGPQSFSQSIPALRSKPRLLKRLLKSKRVQAALAAAQGSTAKIVPHRGQP